MKKLKALIRDYLAAKDAAKTLYADADAKLAQLIAEWPAGAVIDLGDGATAELVDNFAGKNTAFTACGVRRFDLKVSHG